MPRGINFFQCLCQSLLGGLPDAFGPANLLTTNGVPGAPKKLKIKGGNVKRCPNHRESSNFNTQPSFMRETHHKYTDSAYLVGDKTSERTKLAKLQSKPSGLNEECKRPQNGHGAHLRSAFGPQWPPGSPPKTSGYWMRR